MKNSSASFRVGAFLLLSLVLGLSACKDKDGLIDHVSVTPSAEMDRVRVSLVFTQNVQGYFGALFPLKDYGTIFINPNSSEQPLEIGFDFDLSIAADPEYVSLTPTESLPSGVPLGLGYPLVQISTQKPISQAFDLYGYVDVQKGQWFGVATMFKFMSDKNFPVGLTVTKAFHADAAGKPGILASVYGATLKPDGSLARPGGIALLANIKQLIAGGVLASGRQTRFKPASGYTLSGPASPEFEKEPKKVEKAIKKLVKTFNEQQ